jgi:excisionase family DNA binding protein
MTLQWGRHGARSVPCERPDIVGSPVPTSGRSSVCSDKTRQCATVCDMDVLLTPDQVAAEVGVSVETVRRAIRSGRLPAYRSHTGRYRVEGRVARAWHLGEPTVPAEDR